MRLPVALLTALSLTGCFDISPLNAECNTGYRCPLGWVCNREARCELSCDPGYAVCDGFCCASDAGPGDGGSSGCDAGTSASGCLNRISCLDTCGNANGTLCPCGLDETCSSSTGVCGSADAMCTGTAPMCSDLCAAWNASGPDATVRAYPGCAEAPTDGGSVCADLVVQGQFDPAVCTPGAGQCNQGMQTCSGTTWGAGCVGEIGPTAEICNGLDDDCNGETDEGLGTSTCGVGVCATSLPACAGGVPTSTAACLAREAAPSAELCNNLDDDCDGYTDNATGVLRGNTLTAACDPLCATAASCIESHGQCQPGQEHCTSGSWGTCLNEIGPTAELCNNLDDDCDSVTDNSPGNPVAYSLTQACDLACDNWNLNPGAHLQDSNPCVHLAGQCRNGTQSCADSGWAPSCPGEIGPSVEICNDLDDDCDGITDNASGSDVTGSVCGASPGPESRRKAGPGSERRRNRGLPRPESERIE